MLLDDLVTSDESCISQIGSAFSIASSRAATYLLNASYLCPKSQSGMSISTWHDDLRKVMIAAYDITSTTSIAFTALQTQAAP